MKEPCSKWANQFSVSHISPLIVCRGPIRFEAIEVFQGMGIRHFGILLSEKDAWLFPNALSPEVKWLSPNQVHRIEDYTGADRVSRERIIQRMIAIAKENQYNAIFAGYGFMAEDAEFVSHIEKAGLLFIGPHSGVIQKAGNKDQAKAIAIEHRLSVVPGEHQLAEKAYLKKCPTAERDECAYRVSIDDLAQQAKESIRQLWQQYPQYRIRFKAVGSGGGRGQRILSTPFLGRGQEHLSAEQRAVMMDVALKPVDGLILEILQEVKALDSTENKNILLELNIENTRHLEVQLVGNGQWVIALGLRDCSFQMHEQKLIEMSLTQEALLALLEGAALSDADRTYFQHEYQQVIDIEKEAEQFGVAVGLNSVSTFECIADESHHFFMEMNTRIQVEHRVTECVYGLRFANPENTADAFEVHRLIELMVLLAAHGARLPKPIRVAQVGASVEMRLNAMNEALQPHAGGKIEAWSQPCNGEIRDDQAISKPMPATGVMDPYYLAGMYDSNIALIVSTGKNRLDALLQMRHILRKMKMTGSDLKTNLSVLQGLLEWLIAMGGDVSVSTRFVEHYLEQVALTRKIFSLWCLESAWQMTSEVTFQSLRIYPVTEGETHTFLAHRSLVLRPLNAIFHKPHQWGAFLWRLYILSRDEKEPDLLACRAIPMIYELLDMEDQPEKPALYKVWPEDALLLKQMQTFYADLKATFGRPQQMREEGAREMQATGEGWGAFLAKEIGFFKEHYGFLFDQQAPEDFVKKLELLSVLHRAYQRIGLFFQLILKEAAHSNLFNFRPRLRGELAFLPRKQLSFPEIKHLLVPRVAIHHNQIVAETGGMLYAQEAPHLPPFVKEGDLIEQGQPLYILEVMKMFNKVLAPFSGVVKKILYEKGQGEIVKAGQTLFIIEPEHQSALPSDGIDQKKQYTIERIQYLYTEC